MKPECQSNQEALATGGPYARDHVPGCKDCASVRSVVEGLAPPAALIALTMARLEHVLAVRTASRRSLFWRLGLAGAVSLPVILTMNAALVWSLYLGLARVVPTEAAAAGATLVTLSMLLALSIAYGSLPLLASWGLQLRARTA